MAGIGFELRRILVKDSYTSTLRAYIYAGLISSGPWVLSIIGLAASAPRRRLPLSSNVRPHRQHHASPFAPLDVLE